MITQSNSSGNNNSKIINLSLNNIKSCYQRPHIIYRMSSKNKNKIKTIKEKSFDNNINNKENINININLTHKKTNFFRISKNNNINNISLSKNIAFLCGIINSVNKSNNKKINNNIKELIKKEAIKKNEDNKDINMNNCIKYIIIIQKLWRKIYKAKLKKIKLIQKEWKQYIKNKNLNDYYYFSFKKLISPRENNINNISSNTNSNINLVKSFQKENEKAISLSNLRKKFISYITLKFSKFFILILAKLNLFNFIKILKQKISKSINQFVYYKILNKESYLNDYIFFFEAIKRHLKVNLNLEENNNNEIYFLLRENIPKYFKSDFDKNYLPYINSFQEKNIINSQLFIYNDEKLVNYIIYFFEKEKKEKIDEKIKNNFRKYIENDLKVHKLKNRNIFGLMKYIISLKNYFEIENKFYSKIESMKYKESYHSENIKEDDYAIDEINEGDEVNYTDDINDNKIDIKNFKLKFHYLNNNN